MYTIREQNVTEARQSFTSTLNEMASIEEKELIVIVRRRGELVGAIISSRGLQRYSRLLSEQASDQEDSSDEDTQPLQEVTEDREASSEQEETEAVQSADNNEGAKAMESKATREKRASLGLCSECGRSRPREGYRTRDSMRSGTQDKSRESIPSSPVVSRGDAPRQSIQPNGEPITSAPRLTAGMGGSSGAEEPWRPSLAQFNIELVRRRLGTRLSVDISEQYLLRKYEETFGHPPPS